MSSPQKHCKKCGALTERYSDGRCKPCTQAKNKRWVEQNRDAVNARSRRWNQKNADSKRAVNARYRAKSQPEINARRRAKHALDPSGYRVATAKRRGAAGTLPKDIVQQLLIQQQYRCACCEKSLADGYHLDHRTPISRGGTNTVDNVQLLTPSCNLQKYTMTFEEFLLARRGKSVAAVDEQ